MGVRRVLLQVAVVAALLSALVPATAPAAPRWLDGESHEPAGANVAPDVAALRDGNAAVWIGADGHVYAAERPRGGPWGAAEDLEPGGGAESQAPKIVALPDGELVALWVGGEFGFDVRAARRPPGGSWSQPVAIDNTCCPVLEDLVAGADGTAIGLWTSDDGGPETAAKPPGSPTWDPPQDLPNGSSRTELAVAPDGSALVAQPCFDSSGCLEALFRPTGGTWGRPENLTNASRILTGLSVAAHSTGNGFTVAWSEDQNNTVRGLPSVRGEIFTRDRGSGPDGTWGPVELVTDSFTDAFSCSTEFGCLDLAAAGDGTQAVVWQQGPANRLIGASLRSAGGAWGPVETVEGAVAGDAYPHAAFTALGTLVAAWVADGGTAVHGAHRSGPDLWSVRSIGGAAQSEGDPALQDVAGDGEGNAVTGWADGPTPRTAGFDGAGPRFTAFALPTAARQFEPASFAAAADDNWSPPTGISWLFGDGGAAAGAAVSHTYGAPGRFTVTATATDAIGNATQSSGPVDVAPAATPTPTPEPNPCGTADTDGDGINDGCDDNNGAERPRPFRTFNARVVSGEVFLKLPAGAARASQTKPPKGFVRLEGAETIPFGSTLDTARGRVALRSAADTRRRLQRAQFSRGRFVVRQVRRPRGKARRRSTKLVTVLKLTGSSFRRTCGTRVATVSQRRRRSRKRVRRLFGDGRGRFRTSGRNAAATVRGTRWGVQDRCDGTLITVRRGRVSVRDFAKRKTVVVRAGRTYLARRR
jgi:hypothetical protein